MEFLRLLEGIRNPFLTTVFSFFTSLAGEAVLLAILCITFWCISKKVAYMLGFAFMGAQLVTNNLKLIFRIERPWILDPTFKPVESAVAGATGYSFPSGHTCASTSLYGMLAMQIKGLWSKIVACVIILGVIFSRMYLGVHTPLDVSVSFCVTSLIVIICLIINAKVEMNTRNRIIISVLFGICAIASLIFASVLSGNGIVTPENTADSAKMAGASLAFVLSWYLEATYIRFNERGCSLPMQVLKCVIGVAGVLAIRAGFKEIFKLVGNGTEPVILGGVRYFFIVLFAMALYPLVIKKFFRKNAPCEEPATPSEMPAEKTL